jgi:hypothetical protein
MILARNPGGQSLAAAGGKTARNRRLMPDSWYNFALVELPLSGADAAQVACNNNYIKQ